VLSGGGRQASAFRPLLIRLTTPLNDAINRRTNSRRRVLRAAAASSAAHRALFRARCSSGVRPGGQGLFPFFPMGFLLCWGGKKRLNKPSFITRAKSSLKNNNAKIYHISMILSTLLGRILA